MLEKKAVCDTRLRKLKKTKDKNHRERLCLSLCVTTFSFLTSDVIYFSKFQYFNILTSFAEYYKERIKK